MSQVVVVSPIPTDLAEKLTPSGVSPPIRWIYHPWGNRNAARNLGLEQVSTELVYHLDDDVEPPTVEALHAAALRMRRESLAWLGGPYGTARGARLPARIYNLLSNHWARTGEREHPLFLAGHVLVHRDRVRFPQEALYGGEEKILAARLHADGFSGAFDPSFTALHHSGHGYLSLFRRLRQHERARGVDAESKWSKLKRSFTGKSYKPVR